MKKKVLLMGLAAVMVMGAVVGGSLAAGQASAENPVTAPLAAATLNIEWTGGKSDPVTLEVTDKALMPADEIEVKDGYKVDNTGSVDAYIRVTVTKYWADGKGKTTDLAAENIELGLNSEDWLQAESLFEGNSNETEVYYYKYPVPAGQSTSELLESIGIPADLTNDYADKTVKLEAVADGVQFAGADAADLNASGILASWGVVAELDANGNLVSVIE